MKDKKDIIWCLHCRVKLKVKPTGAWQCPKCKCIFKVVIARWESKCFKKHHPKVKTVKKKRGK